MLVDKPVLIVDALIFDDESIAKVHEFLQNLTFEFYTHYYYELRGYSRSKDSPAGPDYLYDTQDDQRSFDFDAEIQF